MADNPKQKVVGFKITLYHDDDTTYELESRMPDTVYDIGLGQSVDYDDDQLELRRRGLPCTSRNVTKFVATSTRREYPR